MHGGLPFDDLGTRYLFVDAGTLREPRRPATGALERASYGEARRVLESLARAEPRLLDRLVRMIDGVEGRPGTRGVRRPVVGDDPRVQKVLDALGLDVASDFLGRPPVFARFHLLRAARGAASTRAARDGPESGEIDRALARLGDDPLLLRGHTHRLVRASRAGWLKDRAAYEALGEAELAPSLRAWIADPARPAPRKEALGALLALSEQQRARDGHGELLLLQRRRAYGHAREDGGERLTPSALRKALARHWIEVQTVDERDKPVASVALSFVLTDGSVRNARSNEDGFARADGIPAGDVTICLPELGASQWRPLGGAGAHATEEAGPPATHVVQRGDSLARIARRHRLESWRELWDHAANAALRDQRGHPNRIRPGDALTVPGRRAHALTRGADTTQRIEVKLPRAVVSLLNAHLVADSGAVDAHSPLPTAKLAASSSLHREDTGITVRMHDLPERVAIALAAPSGDGGDGAPGGQGDRGGLA